MGSVREKRLECGRWRRTVKRVQTQMSCVFFFFLILVLFEKLSELLLPENLLHVEHYYKSLERKVVRNMILTYP